MISLYNNFYRTSYKTNNLTIFLLKKESHCAKLATQHLLSFFKQQKATFCSFKSIDYYAIVETLKM